MDWRDHIVFDPNILVGKPVIKGTRISVELILGWLASGWTFDQILESYPSITRNDIQAALAFGAENRYETSGLEPETSEEIEAFFRNHQVDFSNFKFDREEANAR